MPKYLILVLMFCLCLFSCVKETDFNQADEIVLTQEVEANFLYFTLQIEDFQAPTIPTGNMTVVDTTEIRFLDDDFAVDNIVSAEFFFRVSNTFPVGLDANFTFLSEENEPFYEINFPVEISEDGNPVVTEFSQLISGGDLELLTLNDKVVATIVIHTTDESLEGTLNLQSKTTYFLEFSEL